LDSKGIEERMTSSFLFRFCSALLLISFRFDFAWFSLGMELGFLGDLASWYTHIMTVGGWYPYETGAFWFIRIPFISLSLQLMTFKNLFSLDYFFKSV
jgi:hypothetical protein